MTNRLEVVEAQALALSPEDRAQLADKLIPAADSIARARAAIK